MTSEKVTEGCGPRMLGNARPTRAYYTCWPKGTNRGRSETTNTGHPKSVYIREDLILQAVSDFLADRLFGPHRRDLFTAGLTTADDQATRERDQDRERPHRTLDEITHRQANLLSQAQDCEPGDPYTTGLGESYTTLETQRRHTLTELQHLDATAALILGPPPAECWPKP